MGGRTHRGGVTQHGRMKGDDDNDGVFLARWRSWLLGPGALALVLVASDAVGQISIDIDDAQRITFDSGNFDIRRYSGEMQAFPISLTKGW